MVNVVLLVLAAFMIAFVLFFGFVGAYRLMYPTRTASDRLEGLKGPEAPESFDVIGIDGTTSSESFSLAGTIGQLATPATEEEKNKQRTELIQAGYKGRHNLEIFNSIRVTAALCLPFLAGPIGLSFGLTEGAAAVAAAVAAGYYLPSMYITNTVAKRRADLLKSFPDALDLLVSCVEAGLGLDAAFRRVSLELDTAAPDLAREFQLVTHEISAGVPRVQALRHLEARTGLDEIRSLVNMLAQAERFGTSIANGLRIHSRMTRQKRMSRAEEEAAKVSPKLTVVMILFLMPVLGMVLMGPALIKVTDVLASQN